MGKYFYSFEHPPYLDARSWRARLEKQPWLYCEDGKVGCKICRDTPLAQIHVSKGIDKSKEWVSCKISGSGTTATSQQGSLRTKIQIHSRSKVHILLQDLDYQKQSDVLGKHFEKGSEKDKSNTAKIFRTAYFLSKQERPFSDFPALIDLQITNGLDMGILLQSRQTAGDICQFIGDEMLIKLISYIVASEQKISIMIDESTTSSTATTLAVCMKTIINSVPSSFFIGLIEIKRANSKNITVELMNHLVKLGFTEQWLQDHLICFASDGASSMLGRKAGVATKLLSKFPSLLIWHCANHRLELAVGDTVTSVHGVNNFKIFMDKLYTVYHASPKNRYELKECANEIDEQLFSIGRVLDTRWVSSSFRTVNAVLKNFQSLVLHFQKAANDFSRKSTDRQMYKGLLEYITTYNFVSNICIMADSLLCLSELSKLLQRRDVTVISAHRLIQSKISLLQMQRDQPGQFVAESLEAQDAGQFRNIMLEGKANVSLINRQQFLQSLIDSLSSRLMTYVSCKGDPGAEKMSSNYKEFLNDLMVLEPGSWPVAMEACYGVDSIRRLSKRLLLGEKCAEILEDFEVFKANMGSRMPEQLSSLKSAADVIIVSTAECERCFSVMNDTLTAERNSLAVHRLSALMFVKMVGPEITKFNPSPYVTKWLKSGRRSADTTNSVKRQKNTTTDFDHLVDIFNV